MGPQDPSWGSGAAGTTIAKARFTLRRATSALFDADALHEQATTRGRQTSISTATALSASNVDDLSTQLPHSKT